MCQWKFFVFTYSANTSASVSRRAAEISATPSSLRSVGTFKTGFWCSFAGAAAFFGIVIRLLEFSAGNYRDSYGQTLGGLRQLFFRRAAHTVKCPLGWETPQQVVDRIAISSLAGI